LRRNGYAVEKTAKAVEKIETMKDAET